MSKKMPESHGPKQALIAGRAYLPIAELKSATHATTTLKIKGFSNFLNKAPKELRENVFDTPELDSLWAELLKTHGLLLLGRELIPLPKISVFSQLMGFYEYHLALNEKKKDEITDEKRYLRAAKQGSVQAMLALGDDCFGKISAKKEIDLNALVTHIELLSHLFLTPGHIMAAEIYLLSWLMGVHVENAFKQAIRHLYLADGLIRYSTAHIQNAYGVADFKEATTKALVFRGSKPQEFTSISDYMKKAVLRHPIRQVAIADCQSIRAMVLTSLKSIEQSSDAKTDGPQPDVEAVLAEKLSQLNSEELNQYLLANAYTPTPLKRELFPTGAVTPTKGQPPKSPSPKS